jgi:hypothetical protein
VAHYFAVGWIGLALVNAALANIDGRGPLKYFIGSWFLGPFVTLILASTRESDTGDLQQIDLWSGRRSRPSHDAAVRG